MFKKTLLAGITGVVLSGVVFSASAAGENQGSGKVTFTGEVIEAPCSIKPGDEDLKVNLGEVATDVLNSTQQSLAEDFTIHLQDCILTDSKGDVAADKVKVTFTSANVDTTDKSLMTNTLQGDIGAAGNVGVRILDSGNNKLTLGTAVTVTFPDTSSYQELTFKARMEKIGTTTVTPGSVQAQANYILNYN
ncbi:fimbrial-like protein [Hafnia sp. HMSC23F03]|uniref:fimbrial-like protein n=1 Tax=Hafnia sp. HMSC23F03 TaxID=1581059 RepID=UPI0008A3026D|nr:fimbrial-like protein [Hafnia sp. HMSC23F03]OFS09245.1 fimbrial protein [Hafnia sp. HMSC23F03]